MEGTVERYFDEKGYGFIRGHDNSSYFFHRTHFLESHDVRLFDVVSFLPDKGTKGLNAREIRFLQRGDPLIPDTREYPKRMLVSRDGTFPGGFGVDHEVGTVWSQAKGFANAKNVLLNEASKLGANAVVITKEWETHHSETTAGGWLNLFSLFAKPSLGKAFHLASGNGTYHYRIAHFEGVAVLVSRKARRK